MPVHPLDELVQEKSLHDIALRVARSEPGLVLHTGQSRSGKVTMMAALALTIAGEGGRVTLVTDRAETAETYAPLPRGWRSVVVPFSSAAWEASLQSEHARDADVLLVVNMARENAQAVFALAPDRWVLAAVDTALIGLDTAYALYEMGIDNAVFIDRVRCVWSQFLVEELCRECARPASLLDDDVAQLFPQGPPPGVVHEEVGCPACDSRGTTGREAICEVLLIDDATRAVARTALLEGAAPLLPSAHHVTAQDQARSLLARGAIGVGTFRSAIRRNPLLRAQNQLEREQQRSSQLDLASRHKSEFLANMSHELRTPLNAIIGFSDVILGGMAGPVAESQREFMGDIRDSGKHLLSLINDILDLSKIEAGKMDLHVAAFDMASAIDNALTLVRGRADRQGVKLVTAIDPDLGECEADERKLKQILLNLLTNAVKFTAEGGTVALAASRAGESYQISIRDTGIGIAAEDLGKVFEEFRQVGNDAARKAEGTGLGLSLTRRLVELHGGAIRASSIPGEGSTFAFTFPVRVASPATASSPT
jgi:signal transduction histidine kinase